MQISINKNKNVFDEAGVSYNIGALLYELTNMIKIYEINGLEDKVYVEAPDINENRHVIRKMTEQTKEELEYEKLLWPEKMVRRGNENAFIGFITSNPHIVGDLQSLQDVIEERKKKKVLTEEDRNYYLNIGIQLAEIVYTVHKSNYVIGTLSPAKFWVSKEGFVYSCLTYQFSFENIDAFENPYYITPEWLVTMKYDRIIFNRESDAFLFSIVLFQLLTGKYPFAMEKNISELPKEIVWELMIDGKSVYFLEDSINMEVIRDSIPECLNGIDVLFRRTFDYCGDINYVKERPSISEWICLFHK